MSYWMCCICGRALTDDEVWICWLGEDPDKPLVSACLEHKHIVEERTRKRIGIET